MVVVTSNDTISTDRLSRAFKALGDANRLAIFRLLRRRCGSGCQVPDDGLERTVGEIAREFDLSLSTVSHHLKELRIAGLVLCTKQGRHVHCRINEDLLRELDGFLGGRG